MPRIRLKDTLTGAALALSLAASAAAAPDTARGVKSRALPNATGKVAPAAVPAAPPASAERAAPSAVVPPEGVRERERAAVQGPTGKDLVNAPLAAELVAADVPVAEKLRDLLATDKTDRLFSRKAERAAIEAFYRDRGFAPLWVDKGAPSSRAEAAIAFLTTVDADGLEPADYQAPQFKSGDPEALAEAELRFTDTLLTYARHAQIGRVHFTRVDADIFYNLQSPDPATVLAELAGATSIAEALARFQPQHSGYRELKAKLAEVRAGGSEVRPPRIENGPVLKLSKVPVRDPRVPHLRARLGISGDAENLAYDKPLAEAIQIFQRDHQLAANGNLTPETLEALNAQHRESNADIVVANMERWRWVPHDLGASYVMVNIPDYTLRVVANGRVVWSTRIVVGKPGKLATPIMSETMKFITVNPTWNVPPSIVNNEYLPVLQQDPWALERVGLRVEQNRDGTTRIYQPPGDGNALGRIRFNFPNKFLVYQHDTPDKQLFARDRRAYSHGCMRVQNPDKYAEVLLSLANPSEGYTLERIHGLYGDTERNINLATPIPVHLTYQTAFVDDAGKLVIREDIYGRDTRLLAEQSGDERKVADQAIERRETSEAQQANRLPIGLGNPFSMFFGRLFR
jgi:murein L,D-transpeptidase YcbB/YkuD